MAAGEVTSAQLRAARATLKMEQQDLSVRAGISIATLRRLEGAEGAIRGSYSSVSSVVKVLEAAGIEFIPENGGGAGVRLRKGKEANHPKSSGPATDAVDKMHAAIEEHRSGKKR